MKLNTTTALLGLAGLLLVMHLAKKKQPQTGTARPGSQAPATGDWWSFAGGWTGATGA